MRQFHICQDSPFCTLATGGCRKSLNGTNASFKAEQTSEEVQVIHSTNVGYKAITCDHVLVSTVMTKHNKVKLGTYNKIHKK